jgi:hypothetical protein
MFAFERTKLKDWVADIKALIQKDLRSVPGWGAHTRCLLPGYYVMRFGRSPESLLGYSAGLSQPVYVQQQMLASKATPGIPSRYEWVQEVRCVFESRRGWLGRTCNVRRALTVLLPCLCVAPAVRQVYEQLTLCKYDGRPHTGKNWDRTFTNPR